MNSRLFTIITHSLFATAVIASFVWLAYANAVPSGAVTYVQDFEQGTPFVSDFWPPERFDPVVKIGEYAVRPVVESPVSFFIHPPRTFVTSTIQIVYKLKDTALFEIAVETGPEPEDYKIYQWQSLESLPGDWWRGTIVVPMNDWWRDENNRYHAQMHVSDLLENHNILWVKEMRVKLEGRPHGWREWWNAFQ
ncbi:MAG: hypothetical protein AAB579_04165 [Patescibacteria group bacterium]